MVLLEEWRLPSALLQKFVWAKELKVSYSSFNSQMKQCCIRPPGRLRLERGKWELMRINCEQHTELASVHSYCHFSDQGLARHDPRHEIQFTLCPCILVHLYAHMHFLLIEAGFIKQYLALLILCFLKIFHSIVSH